MHFRGSCRCQSRGVPLGRLPLWVVLQSMRLSRVDLTVGLTQISRKLSVPLYGCSSWIQEITSYRSLEIAVDDNEWPTGFATLDPCCSGLVCPGTALSLASSAWVMIPSAMAWAAAWRLEPCSLDCCGPTGSCSRDGRSGACRRATSRFLSLALFPLFDLRQVRGGPLMPALCHSPAPD